jgi:hypothetical protein
MRRVRGGEHVLAMRPHRRGLADVHDGGREEAEPTVMLFVVVPAEEILPERTAILDRPEAFGKLRTILERLDLRFRKRIVVRHLRPAVRFHHAQIGQ